MTAGGKGMENAGGARGEDMTNGDRTSRIFTLPNVLSLARILLAPVFIWAIIHHRPWLAFGVFFAASATDALDGFTARHFRLKTNIGLWLDPAGDKILLTAALVFLSFPHWSEPNALPLWLPVICIGRDLLIALGTLIYIWIRGMTHFQPSLLGKASTICEVLVLLAVLLFNGLDLTAGSLGVLYILTAALVGISGLHYFVAGIVRFIRTRTKTAP